MTTKTAIPAVDALKYAAAQLDRATGWACDSIAGSCCDSGGHEEQLDVIHAAVGEITECAAAYGHPNRYSDGRMVKTNKEIEDGLVTEHVWHPDASREEPHSWRGHLPSDPGVPSPGIYEVTTYPATQEIHVRVVRAVAKPDMKCPLPFDPNEDLPLNPEEPW
jgi:hypothetical protein